ncbi:MAG: DUF1761 domain-containing protein [Bacteroidia bacterium]|nr:DUF1761 domain-containing protein [Bacteroidia bacterium]
MDTVQAFSPSILGILLAALSSFIIGGLWYSPALFGKSWMKLNGFKEEDLKPQARIFISTFIIQLLGALCLAFFLGKSDLMFSAIVGLQVGLLWVAGGMGVTYLFERKPLKLWLINGGYHIITFILMATIIAAFQSAP